MKYKKIAGLYLVVDPAMEHSLLLHRAEEALKGGVNILQIWNHWPNDLDISEKQQLVQTICRLAHKYEVPVLINDEWTLLKETPLDGIHFDALPDDMEEVKAEIRRDFIVGTTCTNGLNQVRWAKKAGANYISFCAMFPSPSAVNCKIVEHETVQKARQLTTIPIFLSGGITPENINELADLNFDGVAVISGILGSKNPMKRTQAYKKALNKK